MAAHPSARTVAPHAAPSPQVGVQDKQCLLDGQQRLLGLAQHAGRDFLSVLGHELRNPLAALSAAADVLEAAPPGSASAEQARSIISRQARSLSHLVHELLHVGRAVTGELALGHAPVDLAAALERLRRPTVQLPAGLEPEAVVRAGRRVLVVEDNDDVRAALRGELELDGHAVSTAEDGMVGLQWLLTEQPEVCVVDIGLPGLTGHELARHARSAGYGGRLVAISGHGKESDRRAAMVSGFDAYLVKPVDRSGLRRALEPT